MINTTAIVYPYGQDDASSANGGTFCGVNRIVGTLSIILVVGCAGVSIVAAFLGYSMGDLWIFITML
jgi:hypothetical protein